jgi:hypothetical protein
VERIGENRKVYKVLMGKPEGKRLDSTGSGQGPVAGCCKCGDEPSGSWATELVRS